MNKKPLMAQYLDTDLIYDLLEALRYEEIITSRIPSVSPAECIAIDHEFRRRAHPSDRRDYDEMLRPLLLQEGGKAGARILYSLGEYDRAVETLVRIKGFGDLRRLADRLADQEKDEAAMRAYVHLAVQKRALSPIRLIAIAGRQTARGDYQLGAAAWRLARDRGLGLRYADGIVEEDLIAAFYLYELAGAWERVARVIPALLARREVVIVAQTMWTTPGLVTDTVLVDAGRVMAAEQLDAHAWMCFDLAGDTSALIAHAKSLAERCEAELPNYIRMLHDPSKRAPVCAAVGEHLLSHQKPRSAAGIFLLGGHRDRADAARKVAHATQAE